MAWSWGSWWKRLAASRTSGSRATSPTLFKKMPRLASTHQTARSISSGCSWLVPGGASVVALHPRPHGDRLDRLDRDMSLLAQVRQCVEVLAVVNVLHRDEVVRQQHRIEVESIEASPVCGGNLRAVARDADPFDQTFLARGQRRVKRSPRTQRLVPLDGIRQRVHLPEVDVIDSEAIERSIQLLACPRLVPLVDLGREKEPPRLALQPRRDPQL